MNLRDYLNKARREKWAIGQFNFSTLEQLRGILGAAQKLKSPVILGTSEGELGYLGLEEVIVLVDIAKAKYRVNAFLNLDHAKNFGLMKRAVDYGFPAVHFDGSGLTLEKNIEYAKKVVEYAQKKGVLVEGEMEDIKEKNLTSTVQAEKFIKETKVDSLAIAIGNIHGMHRDVKLNFQRLKEINKRIKTFLVLHGGSGIPDSQIRKAIKLGIVKINVNTELRIAWKKSLTATFKKQEIRPYRILSKVQEVIQKKVEEKIKIFGSINKI